MSSEPIVAPGREERRQTSSWAQHVHTGRGRAGLAILGGTSTATAFDPFGLIAGAVVGPALLTYALIGGSFQRSPIATTHATNQPTDPVSWRVAAGLGCVYGGMFQLMLLWWLADSIGTAAWLALGLFQALWFGILALLIRHVSTLPAAPAVIGLAWMVVESARSTWPLGGFPWGRLGYTVLDTPWQNLLPYVGVPATGALLVVAGATLSEVAERTPAWTSTFRVWRSSQERSVPTETPVVPSRLSTISGRWSTLSLGLMVLLSLIVPAAALAAPWRVSATGEWTVSVVQGGVPGTGRDLAGNNREVTENHVAATVELGARVRAGSVAEPDIVIWPENSTAVDPYVDVVARAGIEQAAQALDAPLLVGGPVDGPTDDTLLNQSIVWTSDGPTGQTYTKRYPVPFGEYVPFRDKLNGLSPRFNEVARDTLPGFDSEPLLVNGVLLANAICFDVAFSDVLTDQVRDGAEIVIVQTSNASFFGTSQLAQQLTISRARAAELGRSVAISSTNGYTALIEPDGDVMSLAPTGSTEILTGTVPLADRLTPATRLTPTLTNLAVGAMFLALIAATLRTRAPGATRLGVSLNTTPRSR